MTSAKIKLHTDIAEEKTGEKWNWYWAPVYCALWFVLFYIAAIPSYYSYPETILIRDENSHTNEFIGERAELQLMKLSQIGVKLAGSIQNEIIAVNFLLVEIEKIQKQARLDLYDIDAEVQHPTTGNLTFESTATGYRNISNVIVKLTPKNINHTASLLINAHFDSAVTSSGAADDGVMVVVMLETLRVISKSDKPLMHPIVFLFNGAEESGLLASHGFISQHRWARYCKAFINLDSAGSGGRELLFQSGPNHPWLMKYYKANVPRPYANTIAEELFQNNFVPSDTDFRVFRDYGLLPGLDLAHTLNGYVYHTKFDTYRNLQKRTCQTTGSNILPLAWALANAPELDNTQDFAEGHTVFYDYLGWITIFYTDHMGVVINITSSVTALVAIFVSFFLIYRNSVVEEKSKLIFSSFLVIFMVQVVTIIVAVGVTILIALTIDGIDASECWYWKTWLLFGLYFCPMFFIMCLLPALYIRWTKEKSKMLLDDTITCFMHSHCLILIIICLVLTGFRVRSAYFPMMAIFFYAISVILNIINRFLGKKFFHWPIHLVCQLLPFWFFTYLAYAFLAGFVPMQGRSGPLSYPELFIGSFCILMSIHFAGFILPVIHKFHRSMTLTSVFGVLCLIFIMMACLPIGFPFQKDVAVQRVYVLVLE